MAKSNISPSLLEGEQQNISKDICAKSLIIGIILIMVGIGLFATVSIMEYDKTTSSYFAWGCCGVMFIIWGSIYLHLNRLQLCYKHSALHGYTLYVTNGSGQEATACIKEQNWDKLRSIISNIESNTRIDVVASNDRQFVRCQVMTYVPYRFEPLSEAFDLSSEIAEKLLKLAK